MFTQLTDFRSSETRPFLKTGLTDDGVSVLSSKRKKGQIEEQKIREWSTSLRVVVARAPDRANVSSPYLFAPTGRSQAYTRRGWAPAWKDAQLAWILTFDEGMNKTLTTHPLYFDPQDIRPAAITRKIANRDLDAYDFAAHADPSTPTNITTGDWQNGRRRLSKILTQAFLF